MPNLMVLKHALQEYAVKRLNVMVVDDSQVIRELLQEQLEAHQYAVTTMESGDAAVEALARAEFDVVITDLQMPGTVDGIRLLEIIKEEYEDIEVMIMTGYASVETAVEALRKGAVDYFSKPFKLEELLIWLGRIARKREVLETLKYTEKDKEQGFSDLKDVVNSLYGKCVKVERVLRNESENERQRIKKALHILSATIKK